jgi:hypothetical protein
VKNLVRALVGLVVVALLAFAGWRVFEHFDQQDKIKNANKSCADLDKPTPGATLPAGFTLPDGQRLLNVQTTGKTSVVFASVDGDRDSLVDVRDVIVAELEKAGYTKTGADQEPTFEADATVSKDGVDDTVNVRPLCSGRLVVRYTIH